MPRLPGIAILLLALFSSLMLGAASEPPTTRPPAAPITVDVDVPHAVPGRVTLRITDRFGLPVSGIHSDHIQIIEHGYDYPDVTAIREFPDPDQRLRVLFVIDAPSALSDAELEVYRSAVRRTLTYLNAYDHSAIVYSNGRPQASPANDALLAADAVGESGVFYRREQFVMLDALNNINTVSPARLVADAQRIAQRHPDLPNLIFVLGSGRTSFGSLKEETYDLMASAAALRAPHFTFAPPAAPQIEALESLARLSGGSFSRVGDAASLARSMIETIDRMRIRYDVTYPPFDAPPPYAVGTEFAVRFADSMGIGNVVFKQGDHTGGPVSLDAKPAHNAPTSDFAPLTMQEFFLTAFGTLIVWEGLYALYVRLTIRRDDES